MIKPNTPKLLHSNNTPLALRSFDQPAIRVFQQSERLQFYLTINCMKQKLHQECMVPGSESLSLRRKRWFSEQVDGITHEAPSLGSKAHDQMGAMGLGEGFSFALERDDVRARLGDCFRWNNRLELIFRNKARC